MDFESLRAWLLLLAPILIVGLVLHGYMRARRGRNKIKMKLDQTFLTRAGEVPDDDEAYNPELTGGARVVRLEGDNRLSEAASPGQPTTHAGTDTTSDMPSPPERIIAINVLATGEPFAGPRLVTCLQESGMSHGEMDIFHKKDSAGRVEFSLANAVEPGAFDLAGIETFDTPGVLAFMRVHELQNPLQVFDDMLALANKLANELDGEVKDEARQAMTAEAVDRYRQQIKDFQSGNTVS